MGHTLFASSLVPPPARTAAAFPVSLGVHVMVVGALLALPLLSNAELPPVPVPAIICTMPLPPIVAIALPPVSVAPPPAAARPGPRPGPRREPRTPQQPAAETPATIPVPLTPDVAALTKVADDGAACVGCSLSTGTGPDGGGLPGPPGDGSGPDEGTGQAPLVAGRHVSEPVKLHHVDPVYPKLAQRARVQGRVVIECLIERDGRVARARLTRSIPLLDSAALAAVEQWRYRPTLVNGVAVPVLMTVTVHFYLR